MFRNKSLFLRIYNGDEMMGLHYPLPNCTSRHAILSLSNLVPSVGFRLTLGEVDCTVERHVRDSARRVPLDHVFACLAVARGFAVG